MASTPTKAAATKSILTSATTLKGHEKEIQSISYFPDGQRMISGSDDKTARQWDLKAGMEIEEAQGVCEKEVYAVAVSRNGRWVVSAGGDDTTGELNVCEVETGIVKEFKGHSKQITCIDISADSKLLASGSFDETARIWNLETGKLVAGPLESVDMVGAIRFSTDSKKLAIKTDGGCCIEVWDIQKQKLNVRKREKQSLTGITSVPFFWTNTTILAAFSFTSDDARMIYEFDGSTLETIGTPFEGHHHIVEGLALSFDCALLASSSLHTIKLWAVESRQILATFYLQNPLILVLSPNSRHLAYTTYTPPPRDSRRRAYPTHHEIHICQIPPNVLSQARTSAQNKSTLTHVLKSDATPRPPVVRGRQPITTIPISQKPPPTIDAQQPIFVRLRKLLPFSPARTNAVAQDDQPRNAPDIPATSPVPSPLPGQAATQFDHFEMKSSPPPSNGVTQFLRQHLSFLVPRHSHGPPVIEVAPGRKFTRLAAAKLPEYRKANDTRYPSGQRDIESSDNDSLPDVHWCKAFLCYYSCWSHGKLRKPPRWRLERVDAPRNVNSDNILNRVAVPHPRVHHEEIGLKTVASQSQPRAGPSRLVHNDNILNRVAVPHPRVHHEQVGLKTVASQSQPRAGPSRLVHNDNILNRVAVPPPRIQHEEVELKPMASQSQPEAGPSRRVKHDNIFNKVAVPHPRVQDEDIVLKMGAYQPQPRAGPSRPVKKDNLNRAAAPSPMVQHEGIELKPMPSQSQPEARPP
ncbi:WD40-repeat-containing domain protein [Suillus clintonianus]|uniref:WD40-repeat-containing domain protein n=1 Tax=Suillus clintonianus TaxID=1904413 RepID=UPI001B871578|nr:WD40-repeat-containing domain protein [Suillus clintonianus]KAG2137087.1 WD40-repeat-containing domain protein [Suillus clintonianus]